MTQLFGALRQPRPAFGSVFSAAPSRAAGAPSGSADLIALFGAPVQQGHEDCSSHATAFLMRAVRKRDGLPGDFLPSRNYIYRECQGLMAVRGHETTVKDHGSAALPDAAAVLLAGVPPEAGWPYTSATWMKEPGEAAVFAAQWHKALGVFWLDSQVGNAYNTDAMRHALDGRQPFAFGLVIVDKFGLDGHNVLPTVTDAKILSMPLSGHAVCCVGYKGELFKCFNTSWGAGFGDHGVFWVHDVDMGNPLRTYNHFGVTGFSG